MIYWRIFLFLVVFLAFVMGERQEMLVRPIRPEKFISRADIASYLEKLRQVRMENNNQRYGKRFSPNLFKSSKPCLLQENWRKYHELCSKSQRN